APRGAVRRARRVDARFRAGAGAGSQMRMLTSPSGGTGGRPLLRMGAIGWLTVVLALPLLAVVARAFANGPAAFWRALARPVPAAALWLRLWPAFVMALVNAVMGTLTAWVLVRYRFPGRRAISAIVDLPLAIPTLTTGVMLVVLLGPQHALGAALAS